MPKDIKVREKDTHSIRKLDRSIAFTSRVKRSMSNQYDRLKRDNNEEQNVENSNATNYATTKIMRTGDRGARESAYVITGVSKDTYRKVKMKLAEKKEEKNSTSQNDSITENDYNLKNEEKNPKVITNKQDRARTIKTQDFKNEDTNISNKTSNIKSYQKQKLIKEKKNFKNIKEHNYKNNGIKANNNLMKIKTRENLKNTSNLNLNKTKIHTSNEIMRKSKLQNIKQNSSRIKNIAQKTGKAVVNVARKIVQRNRNANCIWRWYCFSNTRYYFTNSWYVWICIWILIF